MFNSLYGKMAVVLTAVFIAVGGLMIVASQKMLETQRLLELATDLIIGAVAFSLVAALIVFKFLTRRLRILSAAMDAFRAGGFARRVALPASDYGADELDRLCVAFEEMSDRITTQLDELAQVDARRRELLANVSHDLRTPMASMQGYLEVLLLKGEALSAEERRNYLEVAFRHCEHLSRLVSDLFELTKLEARETRPQLESFPLAELAQDVAQKLDLRARQREQRITCRFGAETARVRADVGMIERLLENLIENAMRYTPPGGEIALAITPGASRVEMSVQDTGSGIPADELDSIFDRYYRGNRNDPAQSANTGLGLAIARRIVELHGGSIRVASALGAGTTFRFDLPLAG